MNFSVLIPARLASTRLPNKPLADIGGLPMVVHVAKQALRSQAQRVIVATDASQVMQACAQHGIEALLTRFDHVSGSDRLAECCSLLGLAGDALLVNVQGDEPLIQPDLIRSVANHLAERPELSMATAAYPLREVEDWLNPNVVKVVLKADDSALYFSRAPIAFWRDGYKPQQIGFDALPSPAPLRHIGIYAYRAHFLQDFSALSPAPMEETEALEQLRALWHGYSIGVHLAQAEPSKGVDTPEDLEYVRRVLLA